MVTQVTKATTVMLATLVTILPSVTLVYKDNYGNVSNHSKPI